MASWVGATTQGQISPPAAVWEVDIPAAGAGQTQVLGISYKAKTSAVGSISGWTLVRNVGHSTGPGALALFVRKVPSAVLAGKVSVPFGGAVQGAYICRVVDGNFVSATPTADLEGGASVSLSSITVAKNSTALLEVWASGEWPRVFTTTNSAITTTHQAGISGPGLTFGTRVVNAGAVAGGAFVADDPGIGGVDTTFTGSEDWTPYLGFALLFETADTPTGPTPSWTSASNSFFVATNSVTITLNDAPANTTQYLAVNYSPANTYSVNTPSGWTIVNASTVDEYAGRLVVFERKLATGSIAGSVAVTFTGPCTGSAGYVSITGVTQSSARNSDTQNTFVRSIAIPAVNSTVANALTLVFAGSANFDRTVTTGDATEIFDRKGPPSLAVGFKLQGTGPSSLANWVPDDGTNPGNDGGDAFRVIAISIASTAGSGPSGALGVEVAGSLAYVVAPDRLVASGITYTSATVSWRDNAPDDTEYQYMVRRESDPWPSAVSVLPANSTSVTLSLGSGQDYRFIVLARRGNDFSAWSQELAFTTPSNVASIQISAAKSQINVGGTVVFTLQVNPVTSGLTPSWTIVGGTITNRQISTDSTGRATITVRGDVAGTIRAVATLSGKGSNVVDVSVGTPPEALILSVSPARIEEDDVLRATVTGDRGGAHWKGKSVSLTSSNTGVIANPVSAVMQATSTGGSEWTFSLPGIALGTTNLTAYINGVASNVVAVVVADPPAPPVYTAGVATHCTIHIEAPLAAAVRPIIRRMTDADQQFYFPGDEGFKFAAAYAAKTPVFFTKDRLKNG